MMDSQAAIELANESLLTVLVLAAPVLATVLITGLVVAILQTVTQIQDPSLSQIPKLVAAAIVLGAGLPWLLQRLVEYSAGMFGGAARWLGG